MSAVNRYFDRISSLIRHCQAIDDAVDYHQLTSTLATIDGTLEFYDSSRLEFTEVIRLKGREIQKQRYRYQYLKDGQSLFRYDNVPHHTHVSTFPHHKHDESGKIIESEEPSLKDVLGEISKLLNE